MASEEVSEIEELRNQLSSIGIVKDNKIRFEAVQSVISLCTKGCDMSPLFPEMIMAGATANLVQKKLVYLYLTMYAGSNPELALLAVNTLHKDCCDNHPTIRSLALRALSSLRLESVVQVVLDCVNSGLRDRSAVVRKTAVMAALKLFHQDQQLFFKSKVVSILYKLLRDKDCQVVSNTLCVLSEVLAGEGGIVVTTGLINYLLSRLSELSVWGIFPVLNILCTYQPSSDEELLDILK